MDVIAKVRAALGRGAGESAHVPVAPVIDEPITRLVHSDVGLAEMFVKTAVENSIGAQMVSVDVLSEELEKFLREAGAKRIALSDALLLKKLGIREALLGAGFECRLWSEITLDGLYDFDVGITDVYAAVAETGSIAVRASRENGRALSLVPAVHIAIVEPKNILADLVDLFEKMSQDAQASSLSIITGPSKTSDIEMNLVVGVHGPMVVKVFVL